MTKSELKPGYVVRYQNGELRMVMSTTKENVFVQMGCKNPFWSSLDNYNEALINTNSPDLSVVEVYGHSEFTTTIWELEKQHRKLLWKRPERKKYTYAQLREILGEEFEVVG